MIEPENFIGKKVKAKKKEVIFEYSYPHRSSMPKLKITEHTGTIVNQFVGGQSGREFASEEKEERAFDFISSSGANGSSFHSQESHAFSFLLKEDKTNRVFEVNEFEILDGEEDG